MNYVVTKLKKLILHIKKQHFFGRKFLSLKLFITGSFKYCKERSRKFEVIVSKTLEEDIF